MKTMLLFVKVLLWLPIILICGVFILYVNISVRICSVFGRIVELFLNDVRESCKGTRYEHLVNFIDDENI